MTASYSVEKLEWSSKLLGLMKMPTDNELQKIFDESYEALVPIYRQLAEFSR